MGRYFRRLGVVLVLAQMTMFVTAQQCLLAARGRIPPFEEINDSPRLPNQSQAIITSYKFGCCGNIIAWQTYVGPGSGKLQGVYNITFQVWRPSPTVQGNDCYSLVGENRFNTTIYYGRVSETPEPSNILTVQPGDVVGYYTLSKKDSSKEGIQLDTEERGDSVWYHTYESEPLFLGGLYCQFPVGSETGRSLMSSTNAAPVLSVSLSLFSCPPTINVRSSSFSTLHPTIVASTSSIPTQHSITIPQPLNTSIPLLSHTLLSDSILTQTQNAVLVLAVPSPPLPSHPAPTSSSSLNSAIIASVAAVGGTALLLIFLCTLVLAITIVNTQQKRRRTRREASSVVNDQQVITPCIKMQGNEAYISSSHTTDECYASTINTESHLYETVNTGREGQNDEYEYIYPEEPDYY